MEGHHHELNCDSRKPKDSVYTPAGCLFLEAPMARATHVGPSALSKKTTKGYWALGGLHPDQGYIQILFTLTPSVNQRDPFI